LLPLGPDRSAPPWKKEIAMVFRDLAARARLNAIAAPVAKLRSGA
jgi:hypothetical protein